jgi:hypothetical protein
MHVIFQPYGAEGDGMGYLRWLNRSGKSDVRKNRMDRWTKAKANREGRKKEFDGSFTRFQGMARKLTAMSGRISNEIQSGCFFKSSWHSYPDRNTIPFGGDRMVP